MIRWTLLALCVATGLAFAEPSPEAKPHVDAALRAYSEADYDVAAREFERAYAIDDDPALLYAWAQARRQGGACREAIELYRRYLETNPTVNQTTAARDNIALCEEELRREAPPEPAREPEPAAKPDPAPPPPPSPAERPWYRDGIGAALVGGGVAATAVGVTFAVLAKRSADAASEADRRSDFLDHVDAADSRRRISYVGLGVGAAFLAGGILRFALRDDDGGDGDRDGDDDNVSIAITGSSIGVVGRF